MSYLQVSSNDTLSHLALPGSPETLCGRIVVDEDVPNDWAVSPNPNTGSPAVLLICDVCQTLSQGNSILKQTEAGRECPHCEDGFDETGNACWNCGGTGWLDEGDEYTDLTGIDIEDLRGTKVAADRVPPPVTRRWESDSPIQVSPSRPDLAAEKCDTPGCMYACVPGSKYCSDHGAPDLKGTKIAGDEAPTKCDNCGELSSITKTVGNEQHCLNCALSPTSKNTKTATNWTRDGERIENGFDIIISTDQAMRTPFLDYSRVAVSEQRECLDCHEDQWLSKIASCVDCDGLKCINCMETIGIDSFFGTCKKCAGTQSDLAYEAEYEDAQPDQDRYLSFLMSEEDTETDPLFLPGIDY